MFSKLHLSTVTFSFKYLVVQDFVLYTKNKVEKFTFNKITKSRFTKLDTIEFIVSGLYFTKQKNNSKNIAMNQFPTTYRQPHLRRARNEDTHVLNLVLL